MPRGDKSSYTDKQKRQAEHIEKGYESRGVSDKEAERRAWATVNKETHGGKKIPGPAANTAPSPDPNLPTDEKPPVETVPAQRDPQSVRPPNPRVVIQDPVKPAPTPKRIENPNEEGTKRKGKKGDG